MGKVIAVSSGKGGTGKTTTVAAVASCLAALGYKTLCVDFDTGLRNLDLSLCMADFAVADFMDVLSGDMALIDACHECPRIKNLFFLAAPTDYGPDDLSVGAVKRMFDETRDEFDYCLVDCPAGIGTGFRLALINADMAIIVTNGELPAMRDAQQAADVCREIGVGEIRLLLNRVKLKNFKHMRATIDDIINSVGAQLLGVVREDEAIFLSLHENTPLILYRKRRAAYDFLDVARRIEGREIPLHLWR